MSPVSSRRIMMSSPATISVFSDDALASSSYSSAGRRLANRPSSLRMRSSPCSGRIGLGSVSYLGPPTAPSSTASDAFASANVLAGSGSWAASYPAPPIGASSISMFTPSRARLFSTFTACLTISGPIRSPGNTAIFMFRSLKKTTGASLSAPAGVFNCNASTEQPGLFDAAFSLERLDLDGMLQRDSDLVQTVQQAVLAKGVHLEAEHVTAIGIGHRLRAKIDDQGESRERRDAREYPVHLGFRQHSRQQAVLETVVVEDVGVTRRDQRAETIVVERPGRVLARRAATEILARHQDIRALVARLVQHEIGVGLAP